jgi:hypothetical protein
VCFFCFGFGQEMMYLEEEAERPSLERHALSKGSSICTISTISLLIRFFFFFTSLICPYFQLKFTHLHFSGNAEAIDIEHIKVGSFYEIDHSKLNPQTPDQLRSIRVVMVHIIHSKPTIFITFILIFHTCF